MSPTGPVQGTLPKAEKGNAAAGKKVFTDEEAIACSLANPEACEACD